MDEITIGIKVDTSELEKALKILKEIAEQQKLINDLQKTSNEAQKMARGICPVNNMPCKGCLCDNPPCRSYQWPWWFYQVTCGTATQTTTPWSSI